MDKLNALLASIWAFLRTPVIEIDFTISANDLPGAIADLERVKTRLSSAQDALLEKEQAADDAVAALRAQIHEQDKIAASAYSERLRAARINNKISDLLA